MFGASPITFSSSDLLSSLLSMDRKASSSASPSSFWMKSQRSYRAILERENRSGVWFIPLSIMSSFMLLCVPCVRCLGIIHRPNRWGVVGALSFHWHVDTFAAYCWVNVKARVFPSKTLILHRNYWHGHEDMKLVQRSKNALSVGQCMMIYLAALSIDSLSIAPSNSLLTTSSSGQGSMLSAEIPGE